MVGIIQYHCIILDIYKAPIRLSDGKRICLLNSITLDNEFADHGS